MDSAQWSAKQTAAGFSVSFFRPRQCAQHGTNSGGHAGHRRKQKRRGLKRKPGTTAVTSDAAAANPIGSVAKRETGSPINPPQAAQLPASSSAPVVELQPADHSDYDGESVEQAVDLIACTAIKYDDVHGMKFICDQKEGWTPVIGKRSRHKVPTHLLRLRAPPYVHASLPSSDSILLVRHLTWTALSMFLLVLMFTTHLNGKPSLRVTTKSTSCWTPIS